MQAGTFYKGHIRTCDQWKVSHQPYPLATIWRCLAMLGDGVCKRNRFSVYGAHPQLKELQFSSATLCIEPHSTLGGLCNSAIFRSHRVYSIKSEENVLKLAWKMRALIFLTLVGLSQAVYYGTLIGDFANRFHNVKGKVYAVDSRTIFIKVRTIIANIGLN